MTIDITKIYIGDMVTLPPLRVSSELHRTFGEYVITVGLPCGDEIDLTSEDIASHTPQPRELKVGDWVTVGAMTEGLIIGIDGDDAWVNWGGSSKRSEPMCILTLVDPNQ